MLCGVARCVRNDGVCKCRFSVDGSSQVSGCLVDGCLNNL